MSQFILNCSSKSIHYGGLAFPKAKSSHPFVELKNWFLKFKQK